MVKLEVIEVQGEDIDISVYIKIDYVSKTMSFVEYKNGEWINKPMKFFKRGTSYTGTWLSVIDAMKEAILIADKKIRNYENKSQNDEDCKTEPEPYRYSR